MWRSTPALRDHSRHRPEFSPVAATPGHPRRRRRRCWWWGCCRHRRGRDRHRGIWPRTPRTCSPAAAAATQTIILPTARTALSMARRGAIPIRFADIHLKNRAATVLASHRISTLERWRSDPQGHLLLRARTAAWKFQVQRSRPRRRSRFPGPADPRSDHNRIASP
jgi:hypothetical protein